MAAVSVKSTAVDALPERGVSGVRSMPWNEINSVKRDVSGLMSRLAAIEVKIDALIRVAWLFFATASALVIGAIMRLVIIGGV